MNIYVKSLEDTTVRNPLDNRMIDSVGLEVRDTMYIRRRIADGDLIKCKKPKVKKIQPKEDLDIEEVNTTDKGDT